MRTDPHAFAASHATERTFTPADWALRMRTYAWYLAHDDDHPIGLLGGLSRGTDRLLVAMWVAPEGRGRGVSASLVDALRTDALLDGAHTLTLQVNEHNAAARRVYERLGFTATGDWETLPRPAGYRRESMRLTLGRVGEADTSPPDPGAG